MINSDQIRAARALLRLSIKDFAKQAEMSKNGLSNIERGIGVTRQESLKKIQKAFEDANVEFLPNFGVRKKDSLVESGSPRTVRDPEDLEIIFEDKGPLRGIVENIRKTDGDIIVYGRGPAHHNDIQREYMREIISFIKNQPYMYTRISIISLEFPEASYLWLLFMQRLWSIRRLRGRLNFKVMELESAPATYTPIQSIGSKFVHYAIGGLSLDPEKHVDNMFSIFIYKPDLCQYFRNLLLNEILNDPNCIRLDNGNINDYVNKYQFVVEQTNKIYSEDSENFINELFN